jgi:hypothetical protein
VPHPPHVGAGRCRRTRANRRRCRRPRPSPPRQRQPPRLTAVQAGAGGRSAASAEPCAADGRSREPAESGRQQSDRAVSGADLVGAARQGRAGNHRVTRCLCGEIRAVALLVVTRGSRGVERRVRRRDEGTEGDTAAPPTSRRPDGRTDRTARRGHPEPPEDPRTHPGGASPDCARRTGRYADARTG